MTSSPPVPPEGRDLPRFTERRPLPAWRRLAHWAMAGGRVAQGALHLWNDRVGCPVCDGHNLELVQVGDRPCLYSCERCRLVFGDPRPSNAELRSFYAAARRAPGPPSPDEASLYRRHRSHLYDRLDLVPLENRLGERRRALDVGCGNGLNLEVLAGRGWQVEGVDPNAEQVALLAQDGWAATVADLQQVAAERWRRRRYDLVTLLHVIEHISDPLPMIRSLGALLASGAALVIETPLCCDLGNRDHLFFFSGTSLRILLARAGFAWRAHHIYVARRYAHDNLLVLAVRE